MLLAVIYDLLADSIYGLYYLYCFVKYILWGSRSVGGDIIGPHTIAMYKGTPVKSPVLEGLMDSEPLASDVPKIDEKEEMPKPSEPILGPDSLENPSPPEEESGSILEKGPDSLENPSPPEEESGSILEKGVDTFDKENTPHDETPSSTTEKESPFMSMSSFGQTASTSPAANYLVDNKQYFYLNNQELTQHFTMSAAPQEYDVYLCIYKIYSDAEYPILMYLVNTSEVEVDFPTFKYQSTNTPPPSSPDQQTTDGPIEHTLLLNECISKMLDIFPHLDQEFSNNSFQSFYRGIIDSVNGKLYVFVDSTSIKKWPEPKANQYTWAIPYSITNKRTILGKPLSTNLYSLFETNSYLGHVLDDNKQRSLIPALLYLCENDGGLYQNVLRKSPQEKLEGESDDTQSVDAGQTIDIVDDRYDHPWFGNYFYFSSAALNNNEADIRQYAVFTYNARYILKKLENISDDEKSAFTQSLATDNSTIYFKENDIQLWCIKRDRQFTEIDVYE